MALSIYSTYPAFRQFRNLCYLKACSDHGVYHSELLKNTVFWDVMLCGSCKYCLFRGTCRLRHQCEQIVFLRSVLRLLVTAKVVPNSRKLFNLMMKVILSSETSVLTRATLRNIPEDGVFHSHRRENFKSYIVLTGWVL
jgi:hypothetical protein